ncbi:hypothetical protein JTE90_005846 [Oedothorax gibbosus]|uniref:Uncharacterized protein n=1 Tax=Oedothorax gibbosus TaxID=931172 RepID=A0AAV6V272_9ARAC|nr:hypothetical protein JTE90_005846 [Oedothorax gibbosus]
MLHKQVNWLHFHEESRVPYPSRPAPCRLVRSTNHSFNLKERGGPSLETGHAYFQRVVSQVLGVWLAKVLWGRTCTI